jgi:transposase
MSKIRKSHSNEFKSKVAIEAIKQQKTLNELTAEYAVHASQIHAWKKQALESILGAFSKKKASEVEDQQALIDELYRQLGQVVAERDWLKKKCLKLS